MKFRNEVAIPAISDVFSGVPKFIVSVYNIVEVYLLG